MGRPGTMKRMLSHLFGRPSIGIMVEDRRIGICILPSASRGR